jgi:hypothetical protein
MKFNRTLFIFICIFNILYSILKLLNNKYHFFLNDMWISVLLDNLLLIWNLLLIFELLKNEKT